MVRRMYKTRIATQLLVWFVAVALLPLALATYITYRSSEQTLTAAVTNNLFAIGQRHANQLERYLRERERSVTALSHNTIMSDAMEQLAAAFHNGRRLTARPQHVRDVSWLALDRASRRRAVPPSAAIFDGRTLPSTPESGTRAGYDGAKRQRGSKVHMAVDILGHLLALHVTPANVQDRTQVGQVAEQVQHVTGETVEIA